MPTGVIMRAFLILLSVFFHFSIQSATLPNHIYKLTSEIDCLTKNIYYESRGEPIRGQKSVAQVTLNRVKSKGYPSSICHVVYQPNQFSWTKNKRKIKLENSMNGAYNIANDALVMGVADKMLEKNNALFFHTISVNPIWSKTKKRIETIGHHIFYA